MQAACKGAREASGRLPRSCGSRWVRGEVGSIRQAAQELWKQVGERWGGKHQAGCWSCGRRWVRWIFTGLCLCFQRSLSRALCAAKPSSDCLGRCCWSSPCSFFPFLLVTLASVSLLHHSVPKVHHKGVWIRAPANPLPANSLPAHP